MFFRNRAFQDLRVELARVSGALQTVVDHETRLRRVERWMYAVPAAVVTSIGAVVAALLNHAH